MNSQYEKIIKANYDFKFVKYFDYGVLHGRVRTFCCNSGNAHTCAEKSSEGFTCFNGHAYRAPDPNNHTVNYGIMCEVHSLSNYNSKESQIEMMKKVNALPQWESDNFDSQGNTQPKRKLLDGFDHLKGIYPSTVIEEIEELNKVVPLDNAKYLDPEIKLSGATPTLSSNFETQLNNLYMIGDCALTRGIVKSSITGIMFAEYILSEVNK